MRPKLKANAQALIDSDLRAAGYRYVNLDKCWQQAERDAAGHRQFDPTRLPSGIESLSDWIHERGLSLGLRVTNADCQSEPGTQDHEAEDVESFESWQVDYIKYVACAPLTQTSAERFAKALSGASRPIVLSLTAAPFAEWMSRTAQLWRIGNDAEATWDSVTEAIDIATGLAAFARPGAFNDPDMLEIGNGLDRRGRSRAIFRLVDIVGAASGRKRSFDHGRCDARHPHEHGADCAGPRSTRPTRSARSQ